MKCNVGRNDSRLRLIAGVVLLIAAIIVKSWLLGIIAIVLGVTGVFRFCPAYLMTGINTMRPGNDIDTDDALHETTESIKEVVHDAEEVVENVIDQAKDSFGDKDDDNADNKDGDNPEKKD